MSYRLEVIGTVIIAFAIAGGAIWYIDTALYPTPPSPTSVPHAVASMIATSSEATTTKLVTYARKRSVSIATSTTPQILSFEPTSATVGATITIIGTGFSYTSNNIMFGISLGRNHPNGTADNVAARIASPDGTTLRFTIPATVSSGVLCAAKNQCVAVVGAPITPGNYPISISNSSGTSSTSVFMIIAKN